MHPLFLRQLRRIGLGPDKLPTSEAEWRRLLEIVDAAYAEADQDRYTLERSLTILSSEMQELYESLKESSETQLAAERDKLHEANRFLASIVENIPHMVFVKDAAELRFVRLNRAGEKLLGLSETDALGKNDDDFFPPDQAEFFRRKDREVLDAKGLVSIVEEPIDTADGKRWLNTKKIPIVDAHGRPTYLLGISEDVTEQKQMADRLRDAHDELERRVEERTAELRRSEDLLRQSQKMEAIGRLAGGIAHDFNNLLSVILTYSEMLASETTLDEDVRSDLREIHHAGERATELVRQLLAFSRRQVITPQVLDLNEVIGSMDKMLRRVIGEHIEITTVLEPGVARVKADAGQLEQVIMNLVVNARDAMPTGGTLAIETARVDVERQLPAGIEPGTYIMLSVSDSGIGMDEQTRDRIFEPFFTTKELGRGTGLGLSTVFGIVQQAGGQITVESEAGLGTTFKVLLRESVESRHVSHRPSRTPVLVGTETILLVEDQEQVRTLARMILRRHGYTVIEAEDGPSALEKHRSFPGTIHLLLTDIVMPKMGGRELAERIVLERPGTKVLFMSGYTDDAALLHGVSASGMAFLQKPLAPHALSAKVREVLNTLPGTLVVTPSTDPAPQADGTGRQRVVA